MGRESSPCIYNPFIFQETYPKLISWERHKTVMFKNLRMGRRGFGKYDPPNLEGRSTQPPLLLTRLLPLMPFADCRLKGKQFLKKVSL